MSLILLVALALNLVGTWFIAIELVIRFKGYAFEVKNITYSGQGDVKKTDKFKRWELKRAAFMWLGLVCITISNFMQAFTILLPYLNK